MRPALLLFAPGALGQQPDGEQPLAIPKTRTSDTPVPADEGPVEDHFSPRQRP